MDLLKKTAIEETDESALEIANSDSDVDGTGELPILELQCEEIDMDDPKLDLLEWTVRRIIPIPKAYYWESGNYDVSLRTKTWHRAVGGLGALVKLTDRVGAPIVEATGLTSSRFDYVKSTMSERQIERAMEVASERKLLHLAQQEAKIAEEGGSRDATVETLA